MLLNDVSIRKLCVGQSPMIEPFSEAVSGHGVISYGLSHAGYDLRLADEVLIFKNSFGEVVDPKLFGDANYQMRVFDGPVSVGAGNAITIPPNGYILGRSYEYLRIPSYLKGRCVGKSTLARSGILVNTTPLEPGWEGNLTIEIGNITPCQAKVYIMEGIAQLEFEMLTESPEKDYTGKKYQCQTGVTPARVL